MDELLKSFVLFNFIDINTSTTYYACVPYESLQLSAHSYNIDPAKLRG